MATKIVFLDRETFPADIKLKSISHQNEIISYDHTSPEQVVERIADADIVITNKVKITQDILKQARKLRFIAVAATGTDVIDLFACKEKGIPVSNIRNYAINTVPEHTFALILALRRSIIAYHESVRAGRWQEANQFCYFDYPIKNLANSTLGLIGDGVLGKAVAEVAKAFGMKVLFSAYKGVPNMGPLYTPFEDVLKHSDIISIHCPLTDSTRNMIDEAEFNQMKSTALLINTARGGIVNEEALCDALINKVIAGAAFDVTKNEPPKPDDVIMKLTNLSNFILTPHISWASFEAIQSLADMLMDNIEAFLSGTPQNVVNP
ncbi:D-2-hydroxyacid dehydrogenase [Zophobihabitans entericus]|uniref:D-2-hydroxyacid dehydrogenase n=1 Tax=Zophobihabitans entericus TaxID=1635327 RepID=A0A6G9IDH8_9GAMM|nr:D-2-hydroxyacid dehydrogenase [Zophobihabitans entericus]QIQ22291.1 D-2-hydroxyacid dehydrogenase [Zophobihabitans entericus]